MEGFVAVLEDDAFVEVGPRFSGMVTRLALAPRQVGKPQEVAAGGVFESVGEVPAKRVARWDGEQWHGLGDEIEFTVSLLSWGRDGIWVGAYGFEPEDDHTTLARWDGTRWVEMATPENGLGAPAEETVHTFTDLVHFDGGMIAVGFVWTEAGERNVFHWDGERFHLIRGGVGAIAVDGAALTRHGLLLTGSIAEADLLGEKLPSVGAALLTWPEAGTP